MPLTFAIAIGGQQILNISTATDALKALTSALPKMSPQDHSKLSSQLQSLGSDRIGQIASSGLHSFICGIENLPLGFLQTSNCNKQQVNASSQAQPSLSLPFGLGHASSQAPSSSQANPLKVPSLPAFRPGVISQTQAQHSSARAGLFSLPNILGG